MKPIPVVLFAYARPEHLRRTLRSLRANHIPLLLAYSDGAKGPGDAAAVDEVRRVLAEVDWCDCQVVTRPRNLGLGRNVLSGVSEVAARFHAFIAWEDDLVAVPGTYSWLCEALRHFENDPRVMSVTAWTHPLVIPGDAAGRPYFDGRAECWVWGSWSRSWTGMSDQTALEKLRACEARGIPAGRYGADLPAMARAESRRNLWAVRWLYHHLLHGGLCLRPPRSLVEHIGFDAGATNAAQARQWENPPLAAAPTGVTEWPAPIENPLCRALWVAANPPESLWSRVRRRIVGGLLNVTGSRP